MNVCFCIFNNFWVCYSTMWIYKYKWSGLHSLTVRIDSVCDAEFSSVLWLYFRCGVYFKTFVPLQWHTPQTSIVWALHTIFACFYKLREESKLFTVVIDSISQILLNWNLKHVQKTVRVGKPENITLSMRRNNLTLEWSAGREASIPWNWPSVLTLRKMAIITYYLCAVLLKEFTSWVI